MISLVRALTDELYSEHSAVGCCLHVVTDDFNVRDEDVDFCIGLAREKNHPFCIDLATKYRALTLRERALVLNMRWCPSCKDYDAYDACFRCGTKLEPLS